MLSRRTFMLSALSLPGMSLVSSNAIATGAESTRIIAVTEDICRDTRAFAAYLPVSLIDSDPASMMLHIAKGFENRDFQVAYGLTRDSNMMLLEQYAQQHGYSLQYHGVHSYRGDSLHHDIWATSELLGHLQTQLADSSIDWVSSISRVPFFAGRRERALLTREIETRHSMPADATGQLVSWMFYRG